MLDFAEFVAINKFDRKGAADALRDVRKQVQRNRNKFEAFELPTHHAGVRHHRQPASTTTASPRCTGAAARGLTLAAAGRRPLAPVDHGGAARRGQTPSSRRARALPGRHRRRCAATKPPCAPGQARARCSNCASARMLLEPPSPGDGAEGRAASPCRPSPDEPRPARPPDGEEVLPSGPDAPAYAGDEDVVKIRDKEIRTGLVHTTAQRQQDPQGGAARPYECHGES